MSLSSSLVDVTTGITHRGCSLFPCQSQHRVKRGIMGNHSVCVCVRATHLQAAVTQLHQAVEQEVLGLGQQLQHGLATFG